MLHGILPDIDIQREDTLADVLVYDPSDIRTVIRVTYFPGISLIPANLGLQDAEVKLLDHRENQEEFQIRLLSSVLIMLCVKWKAISM